MTRREFEILRPWFESDSILDYAPEDDVVVRKGYLSAVEGGYSLTERGERLAVWHIERLRRALDSPEGVKGIGDV